MLSADLATSQNHAVRSSYHSRIFGVVLIALACAVASWWLQWPQFAALAVGFIALAALPFLMFRGPKSASWQDISVPARVERGDEACVEISFSMSAGSPTWVSATSLDSASRTWVSDSLDTGVMRWPINTTTRGSYLVGPDRLETGDPFGFRNRVLATRKLTSVLVVPRVHAINADIAKTLADDAQLSNRSGTDYVDSLREYVVGDPMKMVHWRASARHGSLIVGQRIDSTVPQLLVVLDTNIKAYDRQGALFTDFDAESFEQAVEEAASWAWHGCGSQRRVLLTSTSVGAPLIEVTPRNRDSALDMLSLVKPVETDACAPARINALLHKQGIGSVIFVTGAHLEHSAPWVARWKRIRPVHVFSGVNANGSGSRL